ncbi:MAG: pilus assembly protein TadG-related protein [Stellaceae bacterium]
MRGESDVFRRYWHDEQGAISVLAAFVLVAVVGVSALALEYGHGLLQKVENQRAADLAAYGGALVYNSTGSSDSATSAASNIAALNGLSSGVTPSYVSSPSGDGNHAIEVTATTNLPLELARVLTSNTTLPVSATAYAEINSSAPGCIMPSTAAAPVSSPMAAPTSPRTIVPWLPTMRSPSLGAQLS